MSMSTETAPPPSPDVAIESSQTLADRYRAVRGQTEALCAGLEPEDLMLQPMAEASPAKWHLAHTTWFFETFVLAADAAYRPFDPKYTYLFNSYYNAIGERIARQRRGLLSRPPVAEVRRYRAAIDARLLGLLDDADVARRVGGVVELGLHHEQQHQELILTDLKNGLSYNPLRPAYRDGAAAPEDAAGAPLRWADFEGGVRRIGHEGPGFRFDNEGPRHEVYVQPFALATRPATAAEYLAFMADGGYERPELWLSDGWAARQANGWSAPLYWESNDGRWWQFTLGGMRPVAESEPICHVSFYEADAFARWSGARLPTEAEWEIAAVESGAAIAGNFAESGRFHPAATRAKDGDALADLFGNVWEWTASPYVAYPGYRPAPGALGEYNGKFMCNQFVLRGGSCATPADHIRATYRNFFPPESRWQFAGVRLARDAGT
jgi:ergothioneine biosynthesis protein EgtB